MSQFEEDSHENTKAISEEDIVLRFDPALIDFLFINFSCVLFWLISNAHDFNKTQANNFYFVFCIDFCMISNCVRLLHISPSSSPLLAALLSSVFFLHFNEIENKTRSNNRLFLAFWYRSNGGYCFQMTCTRNKFNDLRAYLRHRYTEWKYTNEEAFQCAKM